MSHYIAVLQICHCKLSNDIGLRRSPPLNLHHLSYFFKVYFLYVVPKKVDIMKVEGSRLQRHIPGALAPQEAEEGSWKVGGHAGQLSKNLFQNKI